MSLPTQTPETPSDSQPRPRARKVTLRMSRPSAPETPAVIPTLPPLPPPPPEGHYPPQTPPVPPLPPLPPPHLPPMGGPPSQFSGQYNPAGLAMNAPPTYAHPYGAMPYPPVYPPVPQHSQYAPFQPWGYAQYPMGPPPVFAPGPFLEHPLATQRATAGDEDPPAHRARGRVANGPLDQARRGDPGAAGSDGGAGANHAAPSSTVGARPGRLYPNKEVSNGVWRFQAEVVNDHIKHAFSAQTDMKWSDFCEEVCRHLNGPHSEVHLVFRISGEGGAWTDLGSEYDWADAIARLIEKIRSARTRAVSIEVKNIHESTRAKAQSSKGKGKGKEKRRREDDIPPALSPDMARQLDCLIKLQQHLACDKHSRPGKKTYCWIKSSGEDASGGHEELTHEEMTLWAKHISLGKTTKHTPPKVQKYDYPPTKKARTGRTTPDVHVSVNITPTPGRNSTVQATHQVSTPAPGPSRLAHINDSHPPSSIAGPSTLRRAQGPRPSRILVLLDCLAELRVPTVMELLWLMDEYEPAIGLNYVDIEEEFVDLGIMDSVDLYSLPVELLATFGGLGHDLAHRLRQFCENLFIPLGLVETGDSDATENTLSEQERALQDLEERAPRPLEEVNEVIDVSDEETLVDGAESDVDGDGDRASYRATSYAVGDDSRVSYRYRATSYEV
ncbi:hypothetical protein EDB83DRAFT_2521165 [Lactarius deliciosus]|nr:hypothetical protein EDB83DRAFT_2521165 [Lactarius deliciosus]